MGECCVCVWLLGVLRVGSLVLCWDAVQVLGCCVWMWGVGILGRGGLVWEVFCWNGVYGCGVLLQYGVRYSVAMSCGGARCSVAMLCGGGRCSFPMLCWGVRCSVAMLCGGVRCSVAMLCGDVRCSVAILCGGVMRRDVVVVKAVTVAVRGVLSV